MLTMLNIQGTLDVNYDQIDRSRSNYCSAGCALQKISLNAGKFVTIGVTIGPGIRNRRLLNLENRSYHEAVKYTRQNIYVNLYDVEDRRGWLVDGASAVLHLSRTQLSHHYSPHSGNPNLNLEEFHHANSAGGAETAVFALINDLNLNLVIDVDPPEISTEETTRDGRTTQEVRKIVKKVLFHQLAKRNLNLFELMGDYQKMLMESEGINLRGTDREKLEGWDFLDLVSGESSLKPRVTYLKSSGRGWVDFTRRIHTINLLGRGFGPLIQPADDAFVLCDQWKQVPTGRDLLTTCVSTIDQLCSQYGNSQSNTFRLAHDTYWHKAHLLFEKCKCTPERLVCDRVQVLLPHISTRKKRPEPFAQEKGAVIFGRSSRFSWQYPNRGPPTQDVDRGPEEDDELPDRVRGLLLAHSDSGLGTSFASSSRITEGPPDQVGPAITRNAPPESPNQNTPVSWMKRLRRKVKDNFK
jgi:hypothetical protein